MKVPRTREYHASIELNKEYWYLIVIGLANEIAEFGTHYIV
jgi:hypothetical protein